MKQLPSLLIILFCACSSIIFAQDRLVKSYTFSSNEELKDWLFEGDGKAYIEDGQLVLEPLFYPLMDSLMRAGKVSLENNQDEYRPYLYPAMKAIHGEREIMNYFYDEEGKSVFRGGHFNYWNRTVETPEQFAIEFDFKPLSPAPLHMLMFCASGMNGESVFDPSLPKRYGKAYEIMFELAMYRVSFMNKLRGTANLRRAPGRILAIKGNDPVSQSMDQIYRCRVERKQGCVRYWVDGQEIFSYLDPKPLKGRNWGFRLMVCAKGAYDNVKVWELVE